MHCQLLNSTLLHNGTVPRWVTKKKLLAAPHTQAFIILRDDRHARTDQNSLTWMADNEREISLIKFFLINNT